MAASKILFRAVLPTAACAFLAGCDSEQARFTPDFVHRGSKIIYDMASVAPASSNCKDPIAAAVVACNDPAVRNIDTVVQNYATPGTSEKIDCSINVYFATVCSAKRSIDDFYAFRSLVTQTGSTTCRYRVYDKDNNDLVEELPVTEACK